MNRLFQILLKTEDQRETEREETEMGGSSLTLSPPAYLMPGYGRSTPNDGIS